MIWKLYKFALMFFIHIFLFYSFDKIVHKTCILCFGILFIILFIWFIFVCFHIHLYIFYTSFPIFIIIFSYNAQKNELGWGALLSMFFFVSCNSAKPHKIIYVFSFKTMFTHGWVPIKTFVSGRHQSCSMFIINIFITMRNQGILSVWHLFFFFK